MKVYAGAALVCGAIAVLGCGCAARRRPVVAPLPDGGNVTGVVTSVSPAAQRFALRTNSGTNYDVSTARSPIFKDGQRLSVSQLHAGTPVQVTAAAMDDSDLELEASKVILSDTSPVMAEVPVTSGPAATDSAAAPGAAAGRLTAGSSGSSGGFLSAAAVTPVQSFSRPLPDVRRQELPVDYAHRHESESRQRRSLPGAAAAAPVKAAIPAAAASFPASEKSPAAQGAAQGAAAPAAVRPTPKQPAANPASQAGDQTADLPPDDSPLSPEEEYALNHPPDLTFNPRDKHADDGDNSSDGSSTSK